jgi:hypothetical protein
MLCICVPVPGSVRAEWNSHVIECFMCGCDVIMLSSGNAEWKCSMRRWNEWSVELCSHITPNRTKYRPTKAALFVVFAAACSANSVVSTVVSTLAVAMSRCMKLQLKVSLQGRVHAQVHVAKVSTLP